jgi:hypothetical protein
MTEQRASDVSHPVCPWCSAELPSAALANCPACGATLMGDPDKPLPGVTTIDPEAIVRAARTATPQRRNRLVSWITGEEGGDEETPAPPGSLDPPPPEVRREMLRMELEAEVLDLHGEAESLAAAAREEGLIDEAEELEAVADELAVAAADATTDDVPVGAGIPPVGSELAASEPDPMVAGPGIEYDARTGTSGTLGGATPHTHPTLGAADYGATVRGPGGADADLTAPGHEDDTRPTG